MDKGIKLTLVLTIVLLSYGICFAQQPWHFEQKTRYMVMGDSLGSGYGANPQTQGYAYLLYQSGTFDATPNTLLCNASVIGVTSEHVLSHQVPQAFVFRPDVITLTVGGNDLTKILAGADPNTVLYEFSTNLYQILYEIYLNSENDPGHVFEPTIYIANLYSIPEIPGANEIIPIFNATLASVVTWLPEEVQSKVHLVDIYGPFQDKNGLLLIEKNSSDPFQTHPSNAGHREIANAFEKEIRNPELSN